MLYRNLCIVYICIYKICFLNHLKIDYIYQFSLPPNTSVCIFPKDKDILSDNHRAVIKFRKFNIIQYFYLIYCPYSYFINCCNYVLYGILVPPVQETTQCHE